MILKNFFLDLGNIIPHQIQVSNALLKYRNIKKKIPFPNWFLPGHVLEITLKKPQEIVAPKDESLGVPPF